MFGQNVDALDNRDTVAMNCSFTITHFSVNVITFLPPFSTPHVSYHIYMYIHAHVHIYYTCHPLITLVKVCVQSGVFEFHDKLRISRHPHSDPIEDHQLASVLPWRLYNVSLRHVKYLLFLFLFLCPLQCKWLT